MLLSKKIHLAVEKSIITNVLERIQSGQHKAEFAKDYELQLASDKETMKLYEERRKKVLEELSSQDDLGDIKYTKKAVKENAPKKLDFDVSTAGGV